MLYFYRVVKSAQKQEKGKRRKMANKGYLKSGALALVLVLALVMMLGFVVSMSISTVEAYNNVPEWVLDTDLKYNYFYYRPVDGGVMIVYASESTNVIPAQINGQDVVAIRENAFSAPSYSSSAKTRLQIEAPVSYVGANAFAGLGSNCNLIFAGDTTGFDPDWNSQNAPYITNAVFEQQQVGAGQPYNYLVSFENENIFNRENSINGFNCTVKYNHYILGLSFTQDGSSGLYNSLSQIPTGDETVYVVYKKEQNGGSQSCVAEGTLVTLANGSQVAVESLTGDEELLVWDMFNGTYASAPILFIDKDEEATYEIVELTFSDNTVVKVISEHAFFDVDAQEYVFLREDAAKYVGHTFNKGDVNVELVNVNVYEEVTTTYSPVTSGALCYYVNGMLSMPGNTEAFVNIFAVENMKVNAEAMAADIAAYGLYTYEEFCAEVVEVPVEVFEAFNGQYLKVSMAKGLTTKDEIKSLFDRYNSFLVEEPVEVSVFEQVVNAIKSAIDSVLKFLGLRK